MRIAVVSDVHGSLHALESIIDDLRHTSPDRVFHGGDLVVNGPRPDEVVTAIRALAWPGVVGNTDEMLWSLDRLEEQLAAMPKLEPLLRVMYEHTAPAALQRLSDENLRWLRSLPEQVTQEDLTVLHARPDDLWRAPSPGASDDELRATYTSLGTGVVVYGHIHRPFVRRMEGLAVANSGSSGLAWDGDRRASYLVIDDDDIEIRRVHYPVERDVNDLLAESFPYARWLAEMRDRASYVTPDPSLR